jgi:hypothetical protein
MIECQGEKARRFPLFTGFLGTVGANTESSRSPPTAPWQLGEELQVDTLAAEFPPLESGRNSLGVRFESTIGGVEAGWNGP